MGERRLLTDTFGTLRLELSEGKAPGKLIMRGQFALADVPTANGRRYSESLWQRELGKLAEACQERKLFGELDHPCLTTNDFRVLTVDGWRPFSEVKIGDRVWSRVNGQAVLSTVEGIVDEEYSGPVVQVTCRNMDVGFTPWHRFLLEREGKESYSTLATIMEHPEKFGKHAVPRQAIFPSEMMESFIIPGIQDAGRCRNDVTQDLRLDPKLFCAFLGFYLAEGHCSTEATENYRIHISQTNEWSRKFFREEVLDKFPPELVWHEEQTGFFLSDARLYRYLQLLGDAYAKFVPAEVKRLDAACLSDLLFWFNIGDGRIVDSQGRRGEQEKTYKEEQVLRLRQGHIPNSRRDLFSVSERLIHDLHECVVRAGGSGTLSRVDPGEDYEFAGRTIKAENKVPLYFLHLSSTGQTWMDQRFVQMDLRKHTGRIYCLQMQHGNFYMEHAGKSFWTGNSDGRTKLQRASHVITSLELVGGEVIGEAEILPTPMGQILEVLVKAAAVGVSSRGYGSTLPAADGKEDVGEDYALITFDAVADPAQRTAYPKIHAEETKIAGLPVQAIVETLKDQPGLLQALEQVARQTDLLAEQCRPKAAELPQLREEAMTEKTAPVPMPVITPEAAMAEIQRVMHGLVKPGDVEEAVAQAQAKLTESQAETEKVADELAEAVEIGRRSNIDLFALRLMHEANVTNAISLLDLCHERIYRCETLEQVTATLNSICEQHAFVGPDDDEFDAMAEHVEELRSLLAECKAELVRIPKLEEQLQAKDAQIQQLQTEAKVMPPVQPEVETQLRGQLKAAQESVTKVQVLSRKLEEQRAQFERVVTELPGGDIVIKAITEGKSEAEVDKLLAESAQRRANTEGNEGLRERLRRGMERSPSEDEFGGKRNGKPDSGNLDESVMPDVAIFEKLAGING